MTQDKVTEEIFLILDKIKYLKESVRVNGKKSIDTSELEELFDNLAELSKISDITNIVYKNSINSLLEIFGLNVLSDIGFTSHLPQYNKDTDDKLNRESVLKAVRINSGVGYDYLPLKFRNDPEILYTLLEHQSEPFNKSAVDWFIRYAGRDLLNRMFETDSKNPVNALKILIE